MKQRIETGFGDYLLERLPILPKSKTAPLRAWDAADELLLTQLKQQNLINNSAQPVLVLNDAFGTLAVCLHDAVIHSWSDSYVGHQATIYNLKLNQLDRHFSAIPSTTQLKQQYDLVLIKIPKTLALLEYQLSLLKPNIHEKTQIIAAGMTKHIHTSTLKCFEKTIGSTSTSLAKKKARLVFVNNDQAQAFQSAFPKSFHDNQLGITLSNHANVFSKNHLDIGARLMLGQMQQHLQAKPDYQHIIDLGCGNGVLGIIAKRLQCQASISFVDESYMAVDSAKTNYRNNISSEPESSAASFYISDCLQQVPGTADLILCNPPFHQAHSISDQIAWDMFKQSRSLLNKNGELWVVGNRHLGYHSKLKKLFGNCHTLAANKKFVVLKAITK